MNMIKAFSIGVGRYILLHLFLWGCTSFVTWEFITLFPTELTNEHGWWRLFIILSLSFSILVPVVDEVLKDK